MNIFFRIFLFLIYILLINANDEERDYDYGEEWFENITRQESYKKYIRPHDVSGKIFERKF